MGVPASHSDGPRRRTARASFARAALFACVLATMTAASCNILGPVVLIASGPPKTSALDSLYPKKTTVVFVDDPRSRLPKRILRTIISETAERDLIRQDVLPAERVISSAAAYRVIQDERWGQQLSIVDIGRRVGADVIIYVTVDVWLLSLDGVTPSPRVGVRIKILDVTENRRLWPGNDIGYVLNVEPQDMRGGDVTTSLATRAALEQALAKRVGQALAQTFYKHETRKSATK